MASIVKTLVAGNAAGRSSTGVPAIDWPNVSSVAVTAGTGSQALSAGLYILQATTDVEFQIARDDIASGENPFRVRAGAEFLLYVPTSGNYWFTGSGTFDVAVYPLETH